MIRNVFDPFFKEVSILVVLDPTTWKSTKLTRLKLELIIYLYKAPPQKQIFPRTL